MVRDAGLMGLTYWAVVFRLSVFQALRSYDLVLRAGWGFCLPQADLHAL